MSESILERLRYYARVDPKNAVDELLRAYPGYDESCSMLRSLATRLGKSKNRRF